MYAFGDVKEPANDTVDVMEEILMEYLVDVVSNRVLSLSNISLKDFSVILRFHLLARREYRSKTLGVHWEDMRMERSWHD